MRHYQYHWIIKRPFSFSRSWVLLAPSIAPNLPKIIFIFLLLGMGNTPNTYHKTISIFPLTSISGIANIHKLLKIIFIFLLMSIGGTANTTNLLEFILIFHLLGIGGTTNIPSNTQTHICFPSP